jgi:hypothetical protein
MAAARRVDARSVWGRNKNLQTSRSRRPLSSVINKHLTLRRLLTVAVLAAAIVLAKTAQATTNPSELRKVLPPAPIATSYQSVMSLCQRLQRSVGRTERRPWCGELAFSPGFASAPSVHRRG